MFLAFLILAGLSIYSRIPIINEENINEIQYEGVVGNYSNDQYVQSHSISEFSSSSTGDKSGKPLSNLFDGSTGTFWASDKPNSDSFRNSIFINFSKTVLLDAILYHMAYSTSGSSRRFDGAPLKLNIYSSIGINPLQLTAIFSGTPIYPWTRLQLVFPNPLVCDRIQIEFVDVTPDQSFSGGALNAAGSVMIFIGENLPEIAFENVAGDYNDNQYVQSHSISEFSSSSTGDKSGKPLSNLFDGSTGTFWASDKPNSDSFRNSIFINFSKTVLLDAILYHMAYSTSGSSRRFDGAPLKLNIYSSIGINPLQLTAIFSGTPIYPWTRLQLVFPNPLVCDRIQIEFVDVTPDRSFSGGALNAAGSVMIFIGKTIPEVTYQDATGRFINNDYTNIRSITEFSSSSTGDKSGKPLNNIFDGNIKTFWVSDKPNSDSFHNSIFINFNKTVSLEAILYHMAYSSSGSSRRFDGAPLKLNIYSSIGANPLQLTTKFSGTPILQWSLLQFVFPNPLVCDRIQIEFVEVTPDQSFSGGALNAVCTELSFIGTKKIDKLTFQAASGDYSNDNYVNSNKFTPSSYTSTPSKSGQPLTNLFDSQTTSFWVTQEANSDSYFNSLTINFGKRVAINAILFDTAYSTITTNVERKYHGCPQEYNIFSSINNEKLEISAIFDGTLTYNCNRISLLFVEPIICDRLYIEFDNVTENTHFGTNSEKLVSFGGIHLLGYNPPDFITYKGAEGNYSKDLYVNYCKIKSSSFTYKTDGDKSGTPSTNLFDESPTSFWVSELPNTDTFHNTLSINFTETVTIEAILYDMAYSTSGSFRRFDGAPTKLNVYVSLNNEEFHLNTTFSGSCVYPWTRIQFVFNTPIVCDKIKLEFAEVTPDLSFSGGALNVASGGIHFIQPYKPISTTLKPLFFASGFNGSPIYATVTRPDLYPECPSDLNRVLLTSPKGNNANFLNNNANCVAKLLRVQLNKTTGKVEQLPGITTDSSPIGDYSQLLSYDSIIEYAHMLGYMDGVNLFGVGYNYILHPVTSYAVYDNLKAKIEEVYEATKQKAVIMGHSQGTSFVSIFVSNYSDPEWVKKYVDSVVYLAPAFAGWASFSRLFSQSFSPFANSDEMKKSIMRMPGLHIMLPNYAVFGDRPVIYNMNEDYDQHNATFSVPFLKSYNKMDDESEEIFKAYVEKFLKVPVPEPPVPSFVIYNDKITTNVGYVVFQHQQGRVVSTIPTPGDGTVTSEGPEYACGNWKNVKCLNLNDGNSGAGGHLQMTSNTKVCNAVMDFVLSDKSIKEPFKPGVFLASGFQGSPIYATITDPSKVPSCPHNMKNFEFYTVFNNNIWKFIDDANQSYWLNNDCLAMLSRVELDPTEKFVTYAPGVYLSSSRFGDYFHLLSYNSIIKRLFENGWTHRKNLFGVGYNYMLHPLMSGEIYEELKKNIEKYYDETGMKSFITGHSQGTSFVQIFITDYVSRSWAKKYVSGVIFYAPAFSGWGTYGRSISMNYGGIFPNNYGPMQTSTQRMPGLHIMMPNEGVYGSKTVLRNYPNNGDESNASMVGHFLRNTGRFDDTAYKIFNLTAKYRKPALPEPPVPSLVIYNSKRATGNGYTYNPSNNGVSTFSGTGDGTVSDDGPKYACSHWRDVQCYDYYSDSIDHSNIQTNQKTLDLTMEFIEKVKSPPDKTLPPLPGEPDQDTIVYNIYNDSANGPFMMEEQDNSKVLIQINISNFTSITNGEDGAAVHALNVGLYCHHSQFAGCKSSKSGGAIFFKNSYTIENSIYICDTSFKSNEALYGGAIYLYSSSSKNNAVILRCAFIENKALESDLSKKYGGNAIFFTARSGFIDFCQFSKNDGSGPDVRIYNRFYKGDIKDSSLLSFFMKKSFVISNCDFEISKKSECCIFYDRGEFGSSFEIKKCKFSGELNSFSTYINGQTLSNNSPKLIVKDCSFNSDFTKSIKSVVDDDNFISIKLRHNSFISSKMKESIHFVLNGNMLIAVAIPTIILVCIAGIAIAFRKRNEEIKSALDLDESQSEQPTL